MPRTRSLAWSELKIGILAVVALSLAVFLVFLVGGQGGFFAKKYHLKSRFPNVVGLKAGGLVRDRRRRGRFDRRTIQFSGAQLEVVLELRQELQDKVTTDSRAMIGALEPARRGGGRYHRVRDRHAAAGLGLRQVAEDAGAAGGCRRRRLEGHRGD